MCAYNFDNDSKNFLRKENLSVPGLLDYYNVIKCMNLYCCFCCIPCNLFVVMENHIFEIFVED